MITDLNSYRILVIEDNPGDFAIVEDLLTEQMLSSEIVQAVDFKTASDLLFNKDNCFDIILLDVSLPDKAGKLLITEILNLAGNMPVIVLTGYTDIEFSIQSVTLGILDYLLKDDLNAIALYKSILHAIERKKVMRHLEASEKRYSDLFHLSPQPTWVCDADSFQILDMNQAAIVHYGYTRDELLSMTMKSIQVEAETPVTDENNRLSLDMEPARSPCYIRHKKKNGEIIQVDIHINLVQFKEKQAKLVLINDITERVKYIEAIEEQNKQLREIAWMQSHVVRAPLARMMGIVNVLKQTEVTAEEKKLLLDNFVESGAALDTIIKDITVKTKNIQVPE